MDDEDGEKTVALRGVQYPESTRCSAASFSALKKGSLLKAGKHLGWNFKRRFVALTPPWLLWYVDENAATPSGFAHMDTVRAITVETRPGGPRRGVLLVVEVDRKSVV